MLKKITFKIETIIHILHLVQPNFFMSAIDITDAFLKEPKKCNQIYLKFLFGNKTY